MKVKICGITNIDDALLCEKLGADALGFLFYKKSKRYVSPETASEIISKLSPFTMKIGVFVNESAEMVNKIASNVKLNAVQLHGDENPEITDNISFSVIKSFRVHPGFDFSVLDKFKNVSYLLDTFSPWEYGGTGKSFIWKLIPDQLKSKIILAGGVSLQNIEFIYNKIKPAAVDISSSLEKVPGKKDAEKVKQFFIKLRILEDNDGNYE